VDSGHNTNWFPSSGTTAIETEQATKATDASTPTPDMVFIIVLQLQTTGEASENISGGENGESLVSLIEVAEVTPEEVSAFEQRTSQQGKAQGYGFDYSILYEEAEKKYRKHYAAGKYQTVIIVFEGKVVTTPYDEKGIKEKEAATLTRGQRLSQTTQVK
jgi:hypothetical protein